MNPKVDSYLSKAKNWRDEVEKLRMIILDCGLAEELKWGKPCYTFQETNIVIIRAVVLQRRLVKGCQWHSEKTRGEYAGGTPDSIHQCPGNS